MVYMTGKEGDGHIIEAYEFCGEMKFLIGNESHL